MKAVLVERVRDVVTPMLADGERLEASSLAMVEVPSAAGPARLARLIGVLTLGVLTPAASPQKRFVVLTDRRLLVLAVNRASGHPTKQVVFQAHRSLLQVALRREARMLLVLPVLRVDLTVANAEQPLRLTFGSPARSDGQVIVDALSGAAPVGR